MARIFSILLLLVTLMVAIHPGVASADVTGDCDGEATIKGVTYTPNNDTPKSAIPIPNEDGVLITYSGSVGFENKNHSGSAEVQVGPFGITLGDPWSASNEQDERSVTDGVYELDDFRNKLPIWIPGVWKVTASHEASGGSCSGFAMIKLEGNPLGSIAGWIVLVGLLALAYATVRSITKHRTVGAGLAALFFGLFLAAALMMWGVKPLETLTVVVVPLLLTVAAVGTAAILGRQRSTF
jgi:hypothetical protein